MENVLSGTDEFKLKLSDFKNVEVYDYGTKKYGKFDENAIEFSDIKKTYETIVIECASKKKNNRRNNRVISYS